MRADFSRTGFDRLDGQAKRYAAVLHQQGRVWLDADWNEEVLTRMRLAERATADVVGPCGTPATPDDPDDPAGTGFLVTAGDADDLKIAKGRYYADGMLAELVANTTYKTQPDLLDAHLPFPAGLKAGDTRFGLVYLEVWRRHVTYLEDPALREVALGGPDTTTRLKTVAQVRVAPLPATAADCAAARAHLPKNGEGRLTVVRKKKVAETDPCRLPDESNYTGPANRLYRVEIHEPGDVAAPGPAVNVPLAEAAAQSATAIKLRQPLLASEKAVLIPSAEKPANFSGVAKISENGTTEEVRYFVSTDAPEKLTLAAPLQNAFTAAAVVTIDPPPRARFKWSRDNAGYAVAVLNAKDETDRTHLAVESLTRDEATRLRKGDLVEVTDDASELGSHSGVLARLKEEPDLDLLTVELDRPLPLLAFQLADAERRRLTLRRWDGVGYVGAAYEDNGSTTDLDLGDGIHIQFGGRDLRAGDYWQFAARSIDGSVEALADAAPIGPRRAYCPLAVATWTWDADGKPTVTVTRDCRTIFGPLATVAAHEPTLLYVGGDGQEANADGALSQELAVAVVVAGRPVPKAKVKFAVAGPGDGTVDGSASKVVEADPSTGIASCTWVLDATPAGVPPAPRRMQHATATLEPATAAPPVRFNAALGLRQFSYVGGDGQTARRDGRVPRPLEVAVFNGYTPAENKRVRFTIMDKGAGTLTATNPVGAPTGVEVIALTDANGVATCDWALDAKPPRGPQSVEARLLNAADQVLLQPIRFQADRAAGVAVTQVLIGGKPLANGAAVRPTQLKDGIAFATDSEHAVLAGLSPATCVLTVEFPCDVILPDLKFWKAARIPLVLAGTATFDDKRMILWTPDPPTVVMLTEWETDDKVNKPLLARVTLLGNFIGAMTDNAPLLLDGDTFGTVDKDAAGRLLLPSGDGAAGGDFRMWFRLAKQELKADPTELDFGKINPGGSSGPKSVAVKNSGAETEEVTFDTSSPEFVVEPKVKTIKQNEQVTVSVKFTAPTAGKYTGALRIICSPANTIEVALKGECVAL